MEKWEPGTYNFISCKECNYLVSFDSKFHTSFDKFLSIENIYVYKSYLKNVFSVEYDHQIEMIGIPRLTFLKNGKCGKCNY